MGIPLQLEEGSEDEALFKHPENIKAQCISH
jgi:hypothetical protein